MIKEGCQRCGWKVANSYSKDSAGRKLPKKIVLCPGCYKNFVWACAEHPFLWEKDPAGFIEGYLGGRVLPYPDDANYKRRLALRGLWRLRAIRVRQRQAYRVALEARQNDIRLAAELLGEPLDKLMKKALLGEAPKGISATESRMLALLEEDPVYSLYLKNIKEVDKESTGPGVVVFSGLIGEIGAAKTLLCWHHERNGILRPKIFKECEHSREETLDQRLIISKPNERAYGISAFPTSSNLRSYFGLGFQRILSKDGSNEWWVRAKPSRGGRLAHSLTRKTLAIEFLAGAFEKKPKDRAPFPWEEVLIKAKEDQLIKWRNQYADRPPSLCTACIISNCRCGGSGRWQRSESGSALWVCWCHDNGYWFGSPKHIRYHALGKTASLFLDILYHVWRHIEGRGEMPRHPLALRYYTPLAPR